MFKATDFGAPDVEVAGTWLIGIEYNFIVL